MEPIEDEIPAEPKPQVVSKWMCHSVTSQHWGGITANLKPVYEDGIPENAKFAKATPSGDMTMDISNPAAAIQMKPGKFYKVLFVECD